MALPSKVPGSSNPPSDWDDKGFSGESERTNTNPKMEYAMGLPGQVTAPVENQVNTSNDTMKAAVSVVQGVKNTEKNANV